MCENGGAERDRDGANTVCMRSAVGAERDIGEANEDGYYS